MNVSRLEHLFYALFLNRHPSRLVLMTSYSAYFDASGSPDDSHSIFVSGYVSTVEKWLRFECEWNVLLRDFNIRPPFHMKEFAPGAGQYKAWHDDQAKRKEFLSRAIKIIKLRTNKSFSAGAPVKELSSIVKLYTLPIPKLCRPYPWCVLTVIEKLHKWMKKNASHGGIEIVMEHGDKHQGQLVDIVREKFGFYIIVRKKGDCIPFQACDFLAWEHNRLSRDLMTGKPIRGSMSELRRQIPSDGSWVYFDTKTAIKELEKQGLRKP